MKTIKILILLGSALLLLACEFVSWGGDARRTFSEEVKTYPVNLQGSATVSTPYDVATCTRQGTAAFVAVEDETCSLYISYPRTYTDINGKCVDAGDTEAWLLKGTFLKGYQVCRFETCNDNADYAASGSVKFYPNTTDPAAVTCSLADKNEVQVRIELPSLAP